MQQPRVPFWHRRRRPPCMFVLVVFAVLSAAWVLFAVLLSTTPIHTMNASAVAALAEADDAVAFATFDVASGGLTGIGNSTSGSIPYSKDGTAMGLSKLTKDGTDGESKDIPLDQETIFQYRSVRSHVCALLRWTDARLLYPFPPSSKQTAAGFVLHRAYPKPNHLTIVLPSPLSSYHGTPSTLQHSLHDTRAPPQGGRPGRHVAAVQWVPERETLLVQ